LPGDPLASYSTTAPGKRSPAGVCGMPKAIPGFERLVSDFYKSLCNVLTLRPQISNDVFVDLARAFMPKTLSGVTGTSHSEWAYRFAFLVWENVRGSSGIKLRQFRTGGLTLNERKAITDKEVAVVESLSQIQLPADADLKDFPGHIETEFRIVNQLQRTQGREQMGANGIRPALLDVADGIRALLQRTVELLKAASPAKANDTNNNTSSPYCLIFEPGLVRWNNRTVQVNGKSLAIIKALWESHTRRITEAELRKIIGGDEFALPSTTKSQVCAARKALRNLFGQTKSEDPIPCVDKGVELAWALVGPNS
jgi:hypothetical protein